MDTISVGISLSWTHPPHLSVYLPVSLLSLGPVMTALQQASSVWINLPADLKVGRPPSTNTKTNFTVSLHDTPAHHPHWHPHMHTHCKISSSVSVSSTWTRAGGRVTSPKEKGQRIEGVHHSEVSELLFRRADEREKKEERIGGRE